MSGRGRLIWYQGCANVGRCDEYATRFADIKCYAPKVVSAWNGKPGEIVLKVENARTGFRSTAGIEGLEVSGDGQVFHPVKEMTFDHVNGLMYIHDENVEEPKYVRYCWGDWILGNLISCDGFPMQTFSICVNDYAN